MMKMTAWTVSVDGCMHSARNRIDVWKANLCDVRLRRMWAQVLCEEEKARANNMINATRREQFRSSKAFVRDVLARYLRNASASELKFKRGPHGKPHLSGDRRLKFNVSHTGNLGLVCVSCDREVGIDIERNDRQIRGLQRLMRKTLHEEEIRWLQACGGDAESARVHFLRAWTRKEAFVKCTGDGIQRGLRSFAVGKHTGLVCEEAQGAGLAAGAARDGAQRFRVVDLPVDDSHAASLCYALGASQAPQLRLLQW